MLGGTLAEQKEAERRNYAERSGTKESQKKEGNDGTTPRVAEHWQNREKHCFINENDNVEKPLLFSTTDTLARKRQTCLKELIGALQMLIGLGLIDVVHSEGR